MGMWGRNTWIPPVTSESACQLMTLVASIWAVMLRPFLQLPEPGVNLVIDVSALFLPLCCSFHSEDGSQDRGVRRVALLRLLHKRYHLEPAERTELKCLRVEFKLKTKRLISASRIQLQLRMVRFLSCWPYDFKLRPFSFPVTGIFLDGI